MRVMGILYNTHGYKLRVPTQKKAQFVTALGISCPFPSPLYLFIQDLGAPGIYHGDSEEAPYFCKNGERFYGILNQSHQPEPVYVHCH